MQIYLLLNYLDSIFDNTPHYMHYHLTVFQNSMNLLKQELTLLI